MNKTTIATAVNSGKVLVSDGAWGTFLQQKGLQPYECPELWNLTHPDDVREIEKKKELFLHERGIDFR